VKKLRDTLCGKLCVPKSMTTSPIEVLTGEEASASHFREVVAPRHRPVVLRGLDLGPCAHLWKDPQYVKQNSEDRPVRIHVTTDPLRMDFKAKNFSYSTTGFHHLIDSISCEGGGGERYYLRSTAANDVRSPVNFKKDFPELSSDFRLGQCGLYDEETLFSSVFRASSAGVRVWTHYDVMDNFYAQVVGSKDAILWSPDEALNLYLDGDKSRVVDLDDTERIARDFPKFLRAHRHTAHLHQGDVLYIPALWFHNMTQSTHNYGLAVNLFWKNLDASVYDKKDTYGNRDLLPGAKATRMLDNVLKQLEDLPAEYRDFYARQLIARLEKKCLTKPLE